MSLLSIRKDRDLTRADLASVTHIPKKVIAAIEMGTRPMSEAEAEVFAAALGCKIEDIRR